MWKAQPTYYDSAVIAVHTGNGPPFRPPCPQPETTNIADTFEPDDLVTFVTTYRDQLAGQTSTYRILKPEGTRYRTWTHASTADHYAASYWYWTKALDADGSPPLGTWHFEVDFEGETYATAFDVVPTPAITVTYPNGGELWRPGAMLPIRWASTLGPGADVRVDLYAGGLFHTAMITSTPNDGVQFWRAPAGMEPRVDYTVRVADRADPAISDVSDAPLTIAPVPTADFKLSPISGIRPLTVTFTDTSSSLVDTRFWRFGDGVTSIDASPIHIYPDTGTYTVTLKVDGPAGTDVLTRTHAVTVTLPPLVPDFSAHPLLGTPPLTVTFTDRSTGPVIDRCHWSFGDGVTTTRRHPIHVYTRTGTYTVTLTVGAESEQAQVQKPRYVRVVAHLRQTYLPLILR
jgi:PKD repeat protein